MTIWRLRCGSFEDHPGWLTCCLVTCSSRFAARYRFFDLTEERDLKMWRLKKLRYDSSKSLSLSQKFHEFLPNLQFSLKSSISEFNKNCSKRKWSVQPVVALLTSLLPISLASKWSQKVKTLLQALTKTSCFETSQQQHKTLEKKTPT